MRYYGHYGHINEGKRLTRIELDSFCELSDIQSNEKIFQYIADAKETYRLLGNRNNSEVKKWALTRTVITIDLRDILTFYWSSIEDLIDFVLENPHMPSLQYYCFRIRDPKAKQATFCYHRDMK